MRLGSRIADVSAVISRPRGLERALRWTLRAPTGLPRSQGAHMPVLTHAQLHELVENELFLDPEITSRAIGVVADAGVVTLTGYVTTYAERIAAERAVLRVQGVRAVANDLQVKLHAERIDPDIARSAAAVLQNNLTIPTSVQAAVRSGHVTLEGTVPWMYQKQSAEFAVRQVPGVRSVLNLIVVEPAGSNVEATPGVTKIDNKIAIAP
jgi:BON domain-containing protein